MANLPPNTLRPDEHPEVSIRTPFGGYVTNAPYDVGERGRFLSAMQAMAPWEGVLHGMPALASVAQNTPATQGVIINCGAFDRADGTRIQFAITNGFVGGANPARLLSYNYAGSAWAAVGAGSGALDGGLDRPFSFAVVGQKLCFSRGGSRPVQVWDGVSATHSDAAVGATPARFLFELGTHLLACYTVEGGVDAPQRVRWTGAGDPTDWTSANAGQTDLFNDLGPITGCIKIGQQGFIFQRNGITLVTLTGNGLAPFKFTPLFVREKGAVPYTVQGVGANAMYVSEDDVYIFDGASHVGVGSIENLEFSVNAGVTSEILSQIKTTLASGHLVSSYGCISISNVPMRCYWLRTDLTTWMFNANERSWSRDPLNGYAVGTMGAFYAAQADISPAMLVAPPPPQYLNTVYQLNMDASTVPLNASWSLTTHPIFCGDQRHSKTVKRVRLKYLRNSAPSPITVQISNEGGTTQQQTNVKESVVVDRDTIGVTFGDFSLPGHWFKVSIVAPRTLGLSTAGFGPGKTWGIVEIALLFDVGGEITKTL